MNSNYNTVMVRTRRRISDAAVCGNCYVRIAFDIPAKRCQTCVCDCCVAYMYMIFVGRGVSTEQLIAGPTIGIKPTNPRRQTIPITLRCLVPRPGTLHAGSKGALEVVGLVSIILRQSKH